MPTFTYRALAEDGGTITGSLSSESREAVLEHLRRKGLRPVSVAEAAGRAAAGPTPEGGGRVPGASAEVFMRQVANLLNGGVPLSRALEIILREAPHPAVRRQWQAIRDDVVGGESLATALSRWPGTFPPVYVAMVRAGETGGFLNLVLEQIADFRARDQELKNRVRAALVYPLLLIFMATSVLVFLLIYFIPQFSEIFADFGADLPRLTRLIMGFSGWLMRYGIVALAFFALAFAGMRRFLADERGRRLRERLVSRVPAAGALALHFALVRFCRMLGTLIEAGVPLVQALDVAREAIGNLAFSDAVTLAAEKIKNGSGLARGLAHTGGLFPPAMLETIAVAEESGRVDKEMLRLAGNYEGDLDRRLRMLVSVVEPVLLFVMAGVVGTVVIGMLLPIFTLQELIH